MRGGVQGLVAIHRVEQDHGTAPVFLGFGQAARIGIRQGLHDEGPGKPPAVDWTGAKARRIPVRTCSEWWKLLSIPSDMVAPPSSTMPCWNSLPSAED